MKLYRSKEGMTMRPPRINNNKYLRGIWKGMLNILEAYRDVEEINKRIQNNGKVVVTIVKSRT